jgi:hypothetical protein
MKRIVSLTLLWMALILSCAQTSTSAQTPASPEVSVQRFYSWYLHALNQNQNPLDKQQTELSKFITARLLMSLKRALKRPDGIDADFFIDAQDWDESWEKNISTSASTTQADRATVNVTLKGGEAFGTKRLKVGLRKESGAWKIDSVNGRLNP